VLALKILCLQDGLDLADFDADGRQVEGEPADRVDGETGHEQLDFSAGGERGTLGIQNGGCLRHGMTSGGNVF